MKIKYTLIIIFLVISYLMSSCSKGPLRLEFAVIDSVYKIDGIEYSADYCKMQVLENPQDNNSKIIDIPVIRIRTNSKDPGAPIFFLNDGPGLSNFKQMMPTWLATNHDIVIIGYRGVDGLINLDFPEISAYFKNTNFLSQNNIQSTGKSFAKGFKKLEDSLKIDLKQYNIYNMALDLESARKAFQYEKINIYAVGFGARIAQIYSNISPKTIFRLFLERPKAYGALTLQPSEIDRVLEYYDTESIKINSGRTFKENIIKAISILPKEYNGHIFDKDRIIYQIINLLNKSDGAALVNEACKSAIEGDFESIKYIDELFNNISLQINLIDYAIKTMTSEFDYTKNYSNDYGFNPANNSLGSPLNQFILGAIQKSGYKIETLSKEKSNPDSLSGECISVMVNLDIYSPSFLGEFELVNKYYNPYIILLSDYTPQDLYTSRIAEYSKLLENYLYIGDYYSYMPELKNINLIPKKSFKQLSLEKIQ